MTSLVRIARGRLASSTLRSTALPLSARSVASSSVHASPAAEASTTASSPSSSDTITIASSASAPPAKAQSSSGPASSQRSSKFPPLELPSPLEPAKTHPRTHGHHVATLHLRSHGPGMTLENLIFYTDFAVRSAYALGIPTSLPASLPVRKELWTVPKSPFVHKESQENFERRTHKRVIKVFDANDEVVERWLHWLRIHAMPGVGMRAEVYRSYPLGIGSQLLKQAQAQLRAKPSPPASLPQSGDNDNGASESVTAVAGNEAEVRRLADQILADDLKQGDEALAELSVKIPEAAAESGKADQASAAPAQDKVEDEQAAQVKVEDEQAAQVKVEDEQAAQDKVEDEKAEDEQASKEAEGDKEAEAEGDKKADAKET